MSPGGSGPGKGDAQPERVYNQLVDLSASWVLGAPAEKGFSSLELNKLGPGARYFFLPELRNESWLPVLVGLKNITVPDFAAGAQFDKRADADLLKKQWATCTVFSELDSDGPGAKEKNFYCAPMVTKRFFDLLNQYAELRDVVASVTLGLPLSAENLPPSFAFPPSDP